MGLLTLHLIRHAQSQANLDGLVCGQLNTPLSNEGREQIDRASRSSMMRSLTRFPCFVSPLDRAVETARGLGFIEITEKSDLMETDTGDFSATTLNQLALDQPQFQHYKTDLLARYPGGETTQEMLVRSRRAFDEICATETKAKTVVIVSHAGPLNGIASHLLGMPLDAFPVFLFANASITTLCRAKPEFEKWCLMRMNVI